MPKSVDVEDFSAKFAWSPSGSPRQARAAGRRRQVATEETAATARNCSIGYCDSISGLLWCKMRTNRRVAAGVRRGPETSAEATGNRAESRMAKRRSDDSHP